MQLTRAFRLCLLCLLRDKKSRSQIRNPSRTVCGNLNGGTETILLEFESAERKQLIQLADVLEADCIHYIRRCSGHSRNCCINYDYCFVFLCCPFCSGCFVPRGQEKLAFVLFTVVNGTRWDV